jgi:methionine-rich copper-binding protein CopC
MRRLFQIFLLVALPLLAAGITSYVVRAHAGYVRSIPAADAVIAEAPETLQIWFSQELFRRQGENRIEVHAPDGQRIDLDDAAIDDDDRRLMAVSLPADLPPGQYSVRWRTLSSEDGHEGRGEFVFTVDPDAVEPATAEEMAAQETPTADEEADEEPVATATPAPEEEVEVAATPDATPGVPVPSPAPSGGLPCGSSTALIVLAVGALLIGKRRSGTF